MRLLSAFWLLLSPLLILCLLAGCQRLPHQQDMLERGSEHHRVSSHQMRVLVNEFVQYSAHRIELRADQILNDSAVDTTTRKNALLWKINGISANFRAASRNDPLGAFLDIWTLNRQMSQLAESPMGHSMFGTWQAAVADEHLDLDSRLKQIEQAVGGDMYLGNEIAGEKFVAKFAQDFPLTSLYFDREPIALRYIDEVREPSHELMHAVANLDENVDELKKLSMLYAEHLPKQARWQAELLLLDVTQLAVVQRPLQDFSQVSDAVSAIAGIVQVLPELVAREHQALESLVASERQETLHELERMRTATVAQLETERSIVLDALQQERAEVLHGLRGEREAATGDLNAELSRALAATDAITRQRVAEVLAQSPTLVDHFFKRLWQLCGVLGLAIAILAVLFFRSQAVNASRGNRHALAQRPAEPSIAPHSASHRKRAA